VARDKIMLRGMMFYGFHGASSAEQEVGQRFVVDLDVYCDLREPGATDDLADTISYSKLFRLAKQVLEGTRRKLLEKVAETIAQRVLDEYPVDAVRVKVMKPEVPIKGSILAHAAVEIFRERGPA
jgi:dihydroneopterin aldolase